MELHEIIKELRKEKGINQSELAKAIDYSQAIVAYWEAGIKKPTSDAIIILANYFNVTTDYLLGREPGQLVTYSMASRGKGLEYRTIKQSELDEIQRKLEANKAESDRLIAELQRKMNESNKK